MTLPVEALQHAPAGEGGGTDITRALEHAFALYPQEADKRLLLLTDGNETTGAAKRLIPLARQMGVTIFPVIPPAGRYPDVSLGKLIVPPFVREGSMFTLRLVVRNSNETMVRGRLRILANGQSLTRQDVNRVARSPAPIALTPPKTRLTRAYSRRSRPLRLRASGRQRPATAPPGR